MKFRGRFAGPRVRSIEVATEPPHVSVEIDGRAALYDSVPSPAGGFSLIGPEGRHIEVSVREEEGGIVCVRLGSRTLRFEFLDELTARALATASGAHARKTGDVKAAIPGRVLRIAVAPGDEVAQGQTLLVLEAMKMENEVRAPRPGRVASIEVTAGEAVAAGRLLVRLAE